MTNRLALTLAVAGGYLLGRTKKAKLAIGIGGMVLGKRLQLSPQRLVTLVGDQLRDNPQFAELREQLGGELKGVGRAATDAFVTRRIDALASSLEERTLDVRESLDPRPGREGTQAEGAEESEEDTERDKPAEDTYRARAGDGDEAKGTRKKAADGGRKRSRTDTKGSGGAKSAGRSKSAGGAARKTASAAKRTEAGKAAGAAKKTATRAGSRRTGGGEGD